MINWLNEPMNDDYILFYNLNIYLSFWMSILFCAYVIELRYWNNYLNEFHKYEMTANRKDVKYWMKLNSFEIIHKLFPLNCLCSLQKRNKYYWQSAPFFSIVLCICIRKSTTHTYSVRYSHMCEQTYERKRKQERGKVNVTDSSSSYAKRTQYTISFGVFSSCIEPCRVCVVYAAVCYAAHTEYLRNMQQNFGIMKQMYEYFTRLRTIHWRHIHLCDRMNEYKHTFMFHDGSYWKIFIRMKYAFCIAVLFLSIIA